MSTAPTREREFGFSSKDFETIRRLVGEHTGIKLSESKQDMVYSRLARRLRQLGLNSFSDYCALLEGDSERDGADELVQLVNAITTNLTSFFREPHHFDFVAEKLLPQLLATRPAKRLRIWSAGCSTGEEAYSLAMVIREQVPADWDVRILATDLDSNVLDRGRAGVYPEERVAQLPRSRLRRWFLKGTGEKSGFVRVRPELTELVTFRQLNLLQPWPFHGPFDLIFCRNVVIYFDKATQRKLFARYADLLADDGHLFIGHSESLFKVSDRFQSLGNTIYRKIP